MSSNRNWACSYIEPFFRCYWYDANLAASLALEEAKAAGIRHLEEQIRQVKAVSFDTFKARCLHESVQPGSVHPAEGE